MGRKAWQWRRNYSARKSFFQYQCWIFDFSRYHSWLYRSSVYPLRLHAGLRQKKICKSLRYLAELRACGVSISETWVRRFRWTVCRAPYTTQTTVWQMNLLPLESCRWVNDDFRPTSSVRSIGLGSARVLYLRRFERNRAGRLMG